MCSNVGKYVMAKYCDPEKHFLYSKEIPGNEYNVYIQVYDCWHIIYDKDICLLGHILNVW